MSVFSLFLRKNIFVLPNSPYAMFEREIQRKQRASDATFGGCAAVYLLAEIRERADIPVFIEIFWCRSSVVDF